MLDVPLVDLLHALRSNLRTLATTRYHTELQVWAALAPHKKNPGNPPDLPAVLRA